jgi:hypothetical protein
MMHWLVMTFGELSWHLDGWMKTIKEPTQVGQNQSMKQE